MYGRMYEQLNAVVNVVNVYEYLGILSANWGFVILRSINEIEPIPHTHHALLS
jgi:hypothetical protein